MEERKMYVSNAFEMIMLIMSVVRAWAVKYGYDCHSVAKLASITVEVMESIDSKKDVVGRYQIHRATICLISGRDHFSTLMTYAHEIAHAIQHHNDRMFHSLYANESSGSAYKNNRYEVEARSLASAVHEFLKNDLYVTTSFRVRHKSPSDGRLDKRLMYEETEWFRNRKFKCHRNKWWL